MSSVAEKVDVLVVGGGPAGLAAAIAARQKGFRVAVADGASPAIDKTCGEGLMPATQEALGLLGVTIEPGDGFRLRGIRFVQKGAYASAQFPYDSGVGLRRTALHEKLVARAEQSGVELLWKTPVSGINADGAAAGQRKIRARWIVGADGHASRVRKWAWLEPARRTVQRYAKRRHFRVKPWTDFMEIYWGERTQAYVTPIGSEEVCVALIGERKEDVWFESALADWPQLGERLQGAELTSRERGAVTVSKSLKSVHQGNVALIGDASGSVDAITGEGLRLGFHQSFALANAMEAGSLERYQREHRELTRRPMLMANLMLMLARHPRLRSRVVESFAESPKLFAAFLALHLGEGSPEQFLSAGAQLGWQLLAA